MQGPLSSTDSDRGPLFSQLYFLDPKEALRAQIANLALLRQLSGLLGKLDNFMRRRNPFRHIFRHAKEVLDNRDDLDRLRLTPQLRLVPNWPSVWPSLSRNRIIHFYSNSPRGVFPGQLSRRMPLSPEYPFFCAFRRHVPR
jgi:hypothetical protein